jgi:hypothetical protein
VIESSELLEHRSDRLASALRRLLVSGRVAVVCCPDHAFDADVATRAALKIGADPQRMDPADLATRGPVEPPAVVLACAEGAGAWRDAGLTGRVIADAPNAIWWKVLEARASLDP